MQGSAKNTRKENFSDLLLVNINNRAAIFVLCVLGCFLGLELKSLAG
jgi:hypothetical protein